MKRTKHNKRDKPKTYDLKRDPGWTEIGVDFGDGPLRNITLQGLQGGSPSVVRQAGSPYPPPHHPYLTFNDSSPQQRRLAWEPIMDHFHRMVQDGWVVTDFQEERGMQRPYYSPDGLMHHRNEVTMQIKFRR